MRRQAELLYYRKKGLKKGEVEKEQHVLATGNCIYHEIELRVDLALEGIGWDRGCDERLSESMGIARGGF